MWDSGHRLSAERGYARGLPVGLLSTRRLTRLDRLEHYRSLGHFRIGKDPCRKNLALCW